MTGLLNGIATPADALAALRAGVAAELGSAPAKVRARFAHVAETPTDDPCALELVYLDLQRAVELAAVDREAEMRTDVARVSGEFASYVRQAKRKELNAQSVMRDLQLRVAELEAGAAERALQWRQAEADLSLLQNRVYELERTDEMDRREMMRQRSAERARLEAEVAELAIRMGGHLATHERTKGLAPDVLRLVGKRKVS